MASRIVINAKTQRPSVCNAAEKLSGALGDRGEVHPANGGRTDSRLASKCAATTKPAALLRKCSLQSKRTGAKNISGCAWRSRVVSGVDEAIEHINRYSTKHSETIVTANEANAQKFLRLVDSAAVYWNASTRFTDGGEFGFGAEMGISTQKLHCRGPFALAELTSSKYQVIGTGQIR